MLENLKRNRFLITGVTGLLGSHLYLELKHYIPERNIVCLVRDGIPDSIFNKSDPKCNIVKGDIRDAELVKRIIDEYNVKHIFHLASQTIVGTAKCNPRNTFDVNFNGTLNILEAVRERKHIDCIVASSDKAYGHLSQDEKPYEEDHPLLGIAPYDASKSITDVLVRSYADTFGLNIMTTRCGNLYGPGDLNFNRLIPGVILDYLSKQSPMIRSDGTLVRDYIYVVDAAIAYVELMAYLHHYKKYSFDTFNISTGNHKTVLEIVNELSKILDPNGNHPIILLNQAAGEIPYQTLSSNKLYNTIGFLPRFSLEESLHSTVKWYKKELNI